MPIRSILKGLFFIASLVAVAYLLQGSGVGAVLNERWIDQDIRGQGMLGNLLFLAVGGLATGIGFPRQAIAFLGGYAFGLLEGTLLALLAALLGCVLAFYYARWFGRNLIASRFAGKVQKLDAFLADNPFSMALLIRLLPVGSNLVTNLIAGVSRVPGRPFLLGSGLGYLPQTLVFALAGSGVNLNPTLHIGLAVVLFMISGILGVQLYRKLRHGKSFDEAVDRSLGEAPADK